jgi:hypothetical protein
MGVAKHSKTTSVYLFLTSMTLLLGCTYHMVSGGTTGAEPRIIKVPICHCQEDGHVGVKVPGPGKITLTAQALIGLKCHPKGGGESDIKCMPSVGTSQTEISIRKEEFFKAAHVPDLIPVILSRTFDVDGAGLKTFSLKCQDGNGNAVLIIRESSLEAEYLSGGPGKRTYL